MNPKNLLVPIWEEANVDTSYQNVLLDTINRLDFSATFERVPLLFCGILNGNQKLGARITLAWNLLRLAGRILDDVEDKDLLMDNKGGPITLNVSTGLLFSSNQLIATAGFDSQTTKSQIQEKTNQFLLALTSGQHQDLSTHSSTLSTAFEIAEKKTGKLAELGCWLGTRIASESPEKLSAAREFGLASGMMAQIKDDLIDLWDQGQIKNDLDKQSFGSMPLSFALDNIPDEEKRAILQGRLSSDETRDLIIKSGAPIYLAVQSRLYHSKAIQSLQQFNDDNQAPHNLELLKNLADSLIVMPSEQI